MRGTRLGLALEGAHTFILQKPGNLHEGEAG